VIRFRHAPTLLAPALAACVATPDLGARPEHKAPGDIAAPKTFAAAPAGAWPAARWWSDYGDPQLNALIAEGLAASPDLKAAEARVRRAQALARQAGADRLPSVAANASVAVVKQSTNNGIPAQFVPRGYQDTGRATIDLGFDLDLFGRNRAALAAARSEAEAARLEGEQARLVLATSIAGAYADLAQFYSARDVAASALKVREATLQLVSQRVNQGLDTRAELKQAEARVPAARAELVAVNETIELARNRLAALVGAGPDRGRTIARPAVTTLRPTGLPASLPLELLGRRPDVIAARERARGAARRIDVARAAFYPNVNLTAFIGVQALGLGNLFDSGSDIGSAGPAISLPIFQGGRLQGRYAESRAAYDEAVAAYDVTLTSALREVADAVASQRALATRLADARAALAASNEAQRLARLRYEGGLSTFLEVLSAEEALLASRQTVADLETRAFVLDVALVRALGGGFTTR
jgi:NodT family efflux transporter outer membrane factor (OMF) lipoprotein